MKSIVRILILAGSLLPGALWTGERHSGIDPDGFDPSVRPQDDLFMHVNGRWLLSTEIPADKSNYGSFTALDDTARENIRTIIEESARNPGDAFGKKVGDFYRSYTNEELIEQKDNVEGHPAFGHLCETAQVTKQDRHILFHSPQILVRQSALHCINIGRQQHGDGNIRRRTQLACKSHIGGRPDPFQHLQFSFGRVRLLFETLNNPHTAG